MPKKLEDRLSITAKILTDGPNPLADQWALNMAIVEAKEREDKEEIKRGQIEKITLC